MKKKFKKQIVVLALSLIMLIGIMPMSAYAVAYNTYDVSYRTQSEDNSSWIRYGLTDDAAGSFSVVDNETSVQLNLTLNDGWYLEKWDTWFNGGYDKAWANDSSYNESNPNFDDRYTFFNISQTALPTNAKFIIVRFLGSLYGDFRVDAVVRPILTVNAGNGVSYQVTASNSISVETGVAIEYGKNASVTYSVDDKHVVTGISANYGTQYSDSGSVVTVSSIIRPATVNISTRLKQQTVNFNANGGDGTMAQQSYSYGEAQALTANTFTRIGYTFAGWNTRADGSGTGYTDGQSVSYTPTNDGDSITLYAQWDEEPVIPSNYTVSFDANGGDNIAPISVTHGEKYGRLPSSAVTGLSGGDSSWYLVDENGIVTDTKITRFSVVSQNSDHTLFVKRKVLAPTVSVAFTVPGGLSDGYQYYIPGNSQRVLTASVGNMNAEILDYTYQWYKDGVLIEGVISNVLILDGNVSDSGTYKVEVTATLKDGTNIVVTSDIATASKEQDVKILHAANTLNYDVNGGEGGPQSSYTGGTSLNVSREIPTRENHDFIGWNTKPDGTGERYKAEDVYTFAEDGGNGGCVVTLYAQWRLVKHTVTYKADGEVVGTIEVEHGKDATAPAIPAKNGYVGKWDSVGKDITKDTTISAVYTAILDVNADEVKPEDKSELEDTKKQLEDMLEDDAYTEDDKKAIQDAIDEINDALEVIGDVEEVEELIGKLPENITKNDEDAIKAAEDAYNTLTDYEKSLVDEDTKKALDDAKAALAELNKPADPNFPATGDNNHMMLWIALLFISGGVVITLTVVDRKRRTASKR